MQFELNHKNGVYQIGETAVFKISAKKDAQTTPTGNLDYDLFFNGMKDSSASVAMVDGVGTVNLDLSKSGAWMLVTKKGDAVTGRIGIIVDPFSIQPSVPAPQDFDTFWSAQKQKLSAVPMNAKLKEVANPTSQKLECFDIELDCIGDNPVRGYYVKPAGAQPKSLPAILSLHSAGYKDSSLRAACNNAQKNMLALDINAHGLLNGQPPDYYQESGKKLAGCHLKGFESPETYYFYGMYMRLVRAIDFLTSQPEWNGTVLITQGVSQGGGQALVAAGLDDRVTQIEATVPALCDINGFVLKRKPGWPIQNAQNAAAQKTLSYYDVCSFASRIKGKVAMEVGLIDTTCPAAGVLAAYNQIKAPKSICILPMRGHAGNPETQAASKAPIYSHKP